MLDWEVISLRIMRKGRSKKDVPPDGEKGSPPEEACPECGGTKGRHAANCSQA